MRRWRCNSKLLSGICPDFDYLGIGGSVGLFDNDPDPVSQHRRGQAVNLLPLVIIGYLRQGMPAAGFMIGFKAIMLDQVGNRLERRYVMM